MSPSTRQALLDAMAEPIVVFGPDRKIEQVNARACGLLGYDTGELIGRGPTLLFPDAPANLLDAVHGHTLSLAACVRGGSMLAVELTLTQLLDDEGAHVIATVRDMTERRKAEREQRGSSRLLEACFKHMLTQVAILDPQFNFVRVNESYARATGYQVSDFPGKNHFELFPSDAKAIFERVVTTGEPFQTFARPFVHPTHPEWGVTYWDWTLVPIYGDDGEIEFLLFALEHVTERVRTAEELRIKDKQLSEARQFEVVGQLAAGIAHDFNNVLTSVLFTLELLKPKIDDDEGLTGIVDAALDVVQRAKTLTYQLLSFGRKQLLQPELIELNDFVRRRRASLQQLLHAGIQLQAVTSEPGTSFVEVDPGQLDRVLLNLVSNAADAMPDGGKLSIMTTHVDLDGPSLSEHPGLPAGTYVMLSVQDNGIGMDEDTRQRVFEPFFTTKLDKRGAGLGLSSVQGIVKQSGGEIFVHSVLGEGTTFKILLPRASAPEIEQTPASTSAPEPTRALTTVLVVEDEAVIRKLIVEGLRRFGYSVADVVTGEDALAYLAEHADAVSVVLTDVVMAELDGITLANHIDEHYPHIRTVLMSGYADAGNNQLQRPHPFISKPFSPRDIASLLERVLARPPGASLDDA